METPRIQEHVPRPTNYLCQVMKLNWQRHPIFTLITSAKGNMKQKIYGSKSKALAKSKAVCKIVTIAIVQPYRTKS